MTSTLLYSLNGLPLLLPLTLFTHLALHLPYNTGYRALNCDTEKYHVVILITKIDNLKEDYTSTKTASALICKNIWAIKLSNYRDHIEQLEDDEQFAQLMMWLGITDVTQESE